LHPQALFRSGNSTDSSIDFPENQAAERVCDIPSGAVSDSDQTMCDAADQKSALPSASIPNNDNNSNGTTAPCSMDCDEELESFDGYEPWDSWEDSVAAMWLVRGNIPCSELNLQLQTLREPGFDNSRLPPNVDAIRAKLRLLPLQKVHQVPVTIERRKNKRPDAVDNRMFFYFDMIATLRRAFADPVIRKLIGTNERDLTIVPEKQANFLDCDFSRDPARLSVLCSMVLTAR
jgi:hypothetical protein